MAEDTGFEPVWVLPRGLSRTVQLATLPIFQVGHLFPARASKLPELILPLVVLCTIPRILSGTMWVPVPTSISRARLSPDPRGHSL